MMEITNENEENLSASHTAAEARRVTLPEAVGLDFHSFIPKSDLSSQVHFFSNIRPDSVANAAGLKDGDRILQINGVNVTSLEHEDVRKLMQLVTPMVLTVTHDPKYLLLLQQPVLEVEEKPPALPITANDESTPQTSSNHPAYSKAISIESRTSTLTSDSRKVRAWESFTFPLTKEANDEEPLKGKRCRLRQSKNYDGYGLVLKYQQDLHVIGAVEEESPSYRAGLRENDVILFIGAKNVEKLNYDDVKVMIRAMGLASDQVELIVISKLDIPRYKVMQEKGLIDWSSIGLEK